MTSSVPGDGGARPPIQAVDRAIRLLMAVAFEPSLSTARELAEYCALNRSTAHRLLATLEYHGLVERDPETQAYRIGYGAVRIAAAAEGHDALISRARPEMEQLCDETGDTVSLAVAREGQLYVVSAVQPPRLIRPDVTARALPYHATAIGKIFLAYSSEDLVQSIASQNLHRFTDSTCTVGAELIEEVRQSRERRYAKAVGEFETGLNAVAAAIRDINARVVALIAVSGPSYRLPEGNLDEIGPRVVAAADRISRKINEPESLPEARRDSAGSATDS